ncbi:MAG: hypothetical protein GQE15_27590 [Archangiaceae bacterium]|nr:hypothetical protein [Archangiaceae bacterium]
MRATLLCLVATTASAQPLVATNWNPGFYSGPWGRTTLTLTTEKDGAATLVIVTEQPPAEQRRRFNPNVWQPQPERSHTLTGTMKKNVWTFEGVAMTCKPATRPVHVAAATIVRRPPCDLCEQRCSTASCWEPTTTRTVTGLSCTLANDLHGLSQYDSLFFSAAPGVEWTRWKEDCPVTGFREATPPAPDWSLFPEGTTVLRDLAGSLVSKKAPTTLRTVVTRKRNSIEVTRDDRTYTAASLTAPAKTEDGAHALFLSCWAEVATIHSVDLRFSPPAAECDGSDEVPTSRSPKKLPVLGCRLTVDGDTSDSALRFLGGKVLERIDLDADCTKRKALRALPSVDAPAFTD